jgi:hypothetical protein
MYDFEPDYAISLGNTSYRGYPYLSCPYLLLEGTEDTPTNYLDWWLDPEYYLFEGCKCAPVSTHCVSGCARSSLSGN